MSSKEEMYALYPENLRHGCLQHPEGWDNIVSDLLQAICAYRWTEWVSQLGSVPGQQHINQKSTGVHITQIKEKFGELRVYYTIDQAVANQPLPEGWYFIRITQHVVDMAIRMATYQAARTCMISGKAGEFRSDGYWLRVLSDEENEKYLAETKERA